LTDLSFYRGRRVFVTGHTGFKGAWLCKLLTDAGASVAGYALSPDIEPGLLALSGAQERMVSHIGDIRDLESLRRAFDAFSPEIVLHLAAQPIVRRSYREPAYTYAVNVMGTVNILECVRESKTVRSFVNVTTDKVYRNNEWAWGYRETDGLDGFDPYSNSKSCSELVTASYARSFFADGRVSVSTARAGNVIGGGDFAPDRIIPDCVRAALRGEAIVVRNPDSVRPYQHVLEPLSAYLAIAQAQYGHPELAASYNIGPGEDGCARTGELVELFCRHWGEGASWRVQGDGGPHEANFLKLDCSRIRTALGWRPRWSLPEAVAHTVSWAKTYAAGEDVAALMTRQAAEYFNGWGCAHV